MAKHRTRKKLADHELYIGPETKRAYEIHKQIRAASAALDRRKCTDATMHLYEAHDMMSRGRDVGPRMRALFNEEKRRLQSTCRVNFAARMRRRRWT